MSVISDLWVERRWGSWDDAARRGASVVAIPHLWISLALLRLTSPVVLQRPTAMRLVSLDVFRYFGNDLRLRPRLVGMIPISTILVLVQLPLRVLSIREIKGQVLSDLSSRILLVLRIGLVNGSTI